MDGDSLDQDVNRPQETTVPEIDRAFPRTDTEVDERLFLKSVARAMDVLSVFAENPTPIEIPYGAAKSGIHSITKSLARAFAPKVRVNCIMPGAFMTDISKAWSPEMHAGLERTIPLRRGGAPSEIVGAALYFASDASRYATGSILKVDGGATYGLG